MRQRVEHRAQRQRRRNRHAVAGVAQPRPGHRDVDRDQQCVEAGRGGASHQRHRAVPILPHVELKPVAALRVRGRDVLDRGGAQRRQRERDAGPCRRVRAGDLALGVHQPGEPGRRDAERQRDRLAEHMPAGVDLRDVAQDRRVKLDVAERLAGPRQRQFVLGRAVGVVERRFRGPALGDPAQVLDRQRVVESALGAVSRGLRNCISGARSRTFGIRRVTTVPP